MAISLNHHENKVATTIQKLTNRIGNASMDVVFDEFPELKTEFDEFTTRYRSGFSDIPKTWSDIHELHSSSLGKTNYSYSEIRMHDLYNVQSSDLMKFENDTSLFLMGKDCVLREYMPTDYLKSNVDPNFDMSTVRIFGVNSPSKAIVYSNSTRNSNGTENSSSVKEGDMLLYLLNTKTNDVTHFVVPQEMVAQFLNVAPINEELLKKEQESRMSSPGHESEKVVAEKYFKAKHEEQIEYRKNFTEEKQPLELVKKTLVKNWIEHLNDFYTKATESKAEAEKASKSADPLKFVAEPLKEFMEARKKELNLKGVSKTVGQDEIVKRLYGLREKAEKAQAVNMAKTPAPKF